MAWGSTPEEDAGSEIGSGALALRPEEERYYLVKYQYWGCNQPSALAEYPANFLSISVAA
jgi:hypothetical protein